MFIGFDRPPLLPERAGITRFPHRGIPRGSEFFTGRVLELRQQARDGDAVFVGTFQTNGIYGNVLDFSTDTAESIMTEAFATNTPIIIRGWIDHRGHLHIKESTFV